MTRRVLDVGNCDLDHGHLRALVEGSFDARLDRCHTADEAVAALRRDPADLVLINRQLDHDLSEGVELIQRIKADAQLRAIPCMLITNFPEHQASAVAVGAEPGFGKRALNHPETHALLARFLQ